MWPSSNRKIHTQPNTCHYSDAIATCTDNTYYNHFSQPAISKDGSIPVRASSVGRSFTVTQTATTVTVAEVDGDFQAVYQKNTSEHYWVWVEMNGNQNVEITSLVTPEDDGDRPVVVPSEASEEASGGEEEEEGGADEEEHREVDCNNELFFFNEFSSPFGALRCGDSDCVCDGNRQCNNGYCEGKSRPDSECLSVDHRAEENENRTCESTCDCDGLRQCVGGVCKGTSRYVIDREEERDSDDCIVFYSECNFQGEKYKVCEVNQEIDSDFKAYCIYVPPGADGIVFRTTLEDGEPTELAVSGTQNCINRGVSTRSLVQ